MQDFDFDLCVIGGGINGAGIARDAAGRGLSVILVEAGDLASATSSASTKLIHGGLRYLEYYEFKLVRDSLKEREVLLQQAPHIISPMEFVLPHDTGQRSYLMLRAGLFLYDHLAQSKTKRSMLRKSRGLNLQTHPYGAVLKDSLKKGFCYTDCAVDDSRLVVLNAMGAAEKGARILTRTACTNIRCEGEGWIVSISDKRSKSQSDIRAKMVVNATGPWVRGVIESSELETPDTPGIKLVKGSHIIIKRSFEGSQAYIMQQPDKRIVFAIPYERKYTLIGTTEESFSGDPADVKISDTEIDYLCRAFNSSFERQITRDDAVWSYSGVRPLFDDGGDEMTSVTRDYRLYLHEGSAAPMISVFGGKLTTYRVLAEKAVNELMQITGEVIPPWTAGSHLPGGDIPAANFGAFLENIAIKYPFLPEELLLRYASSYGTRMDRFLDGSGSMKDLGRHFGDNVFEVEIVYLVQYEFAQEIEDILWRRSKLGMHVSNKTVQNLSMILPEIVRNYQKGG